VHYLRGSTTGAAERPSERANDYRCVHMRYAVLRDTLAAEMNMDG
jgi:hypothetical protein